MGIDYLVYRGIKLEVMHKPDMVKEASNNGVIDVASSLDEYLQHPLPNTSFKVYGTIPPSDGFKKTLMLISRDDQYIFIPVGEELEQCEINKLPKLLPIYPHDETWQYHIISDAKGG